MTREPVGITKDTQLCISLAGRPSSIGTRFHNYLYAELGLDFVYKAFTTSDIEGAVRGIRALSIRGAGVSMPFKEAVIPLVDVMEESALAIASVNTIVNDDGGLHAYNTDYSAVASLLRSYRVPTAGGFALTGSGGMARAVAAALRDGGHVDGLVVARNEQTGRALAQEFGFGWVPSIGDQRPHLLVNATPVGMAGGPAAGDLAFPAEVIDAAEVVFEVVAVPELTPMVRRARVSGRRTITGREVIALQAAEQFELYTGVRPTDDQVRRASEYSRDQQV